MTDAIHTRAAMRFAYADPPYVGQAQRIYGDHPDYAGEVDHAELIERLERDYDGWALSGTTTSLGFVLNMAPASRVLAWVKTNAAFKPGSRVVHSWEPVIVSRKYPRPSTAPIVRDWCASPIVQRNHNNTKGSKPREFCFWLFDVLGLQEEDVLDDLYPGSGAVTRYLDEWRSQLRLPVGDDRPSRRVLVGQTMIEETP